MITFDKVTKKFGSIIAVEDVSFEIAAGEFVFLTGPSGAGKTTLIRLLLREFIPDSGKILIEGKDITNLRRSDLPFYRRKIGVVFQDFKLLPERTVYENVYLPLEIEGGSDQARDKKVQAALEEVGMESRKDLFPRQLSGGELQRTVIARALVMQPKIILADEPTGNLDPATSRQIITLLDNAASSGTTVIMATHNADIVNARERRVILVKDGKVVSDKKKGKYTE